MQEVMADREPDRATVSHVMGSDLRFHHLTAVAPRPLQTQDEIGRLFDELAAALPSGAQKLQQKVFVSADGVEVALAALEERDPHREVPTTLVLDEPCVGGRVAGIQVLAVEGEGSCRTVFDGDRPAGRLLEFGGARVLHLADVHAQSMPTADPAEQMAAMFERVGALVAQCSLTFQQVARTWIYVDRLLDVYADLNQARDEFFAREAVDHAISAPPASTGIQGAHPSGAAAFMDLVAVDGAGPLVPMRTSHQCEAYDYGSAFSRGMIVDLAGVRFLYASGTASIDHRGETVHVGDPHGQIRETYAAVDTLLGRQGSGLADAVTGVLYFKDDASYRAWKELRERRELPDLPAIPVFADVCRPELLFELEVTAVT